MKKPYSVVGQLFHRILTPVSAWERTQMLAIRIVKASSILQLSLLP